MTDQNFTWVNGPFPLIKTDKADRDPNRHYAITLAVEMGSVHNMLIRGLNSMYRQAPMIKNEKDAADFFIFCNSWILTVAHHHEMEETYLFKDITKHTHDPEILAREKEQHHQIHDGLDRMSKYIKRTEPKDFKWSDLEAIFSSFTPVLSDHLHQECQKLRSLKDSDCTEHELKEAWEKMEKNAVDTSLPNMMEIIVPFALGNIDATFEDGAHSHFPRVPFFLPWMSYLWYGKKYSGAWRFNPCDVWRQPRPLQFIDDEKTN